MNGLKGEKIHSVERGQADSSQLSFQPSRGLLPLTVVEEVSRVDTLLCQNSAKTSDTRICYG
jgi:hypothetical protein